MDEYRRMAKSMDLQPKVLADGSMLAQIAIVGEGPGEREVTTGIPFSGGAGSKLWTELRKYGIRRQDCYITNVIKRQVSLSSKADERRSVSRQELAYWIQLAKWELAQLPNVKYIICLGNAACEAVINETGITAWRGSVVDCPDIRVGCKALLTFNPAHVLREPRWEVMFNFDISKIKMVIDGKYEPYHITHHINPSFDDAMDWIKKMRDDKKPVSIDIETVAAETACVGLCNDPHEGMCINFRTIDGDHFSLEQEVRIRRALQALADSGAEFVAQNGVFEHYWMWFKDSINLRRIWFDTLLAHHTLYPTMPHNLGALTAQYTTHPYYKDDKDTWREKGDIDQFWRYNVKDICITLACQKALRRELHAQKLSDFFFNHVMRLQPHLVRATVLGVAVDVDLKAKLNEELTEEVEQQRLHFVQLAQQATGDNTFEPNPNSWPQLRDLFFNKLRLVGYGTSTNKANRQRMKEHPGTSEVARDMLNALDKYKEDAKFLNTYVEVEIDDDQRMRCEYKQFGTQEAPGRLSSSQTLWGSGMNMQNQPKRAYEMFCADPGCGFAYFDLAQAEARIVAWLAPIHDWIQDFERARTEGGFDCHRSLAAAMWGIPYDDVPMEDYDRNGEHSIRWKAKRCRHGLNYRMGPFVLSETTGMSFQESVTNHRIYHFTTPEVRKWWDDTIAECRKQGYLMSPMGRRLLIMEKMTDDALDSIIAFKPQSCIGDKVCEVWYLSEDDPDWPRNGRIAMNIHDALIAHAPVEHLPRCAAIMKKHAEKALYIEGMDGVARELIIPTDVKISQPGPDGVHRWSTLKDVEAESLLAVS